jgi:DNA polymerase III delta prime subunit
VRFVEEYSNSRRLNESQRDVLKSALASLLAEDTTPHVRMVQGPPGTGKTTLLVTLISVLGCLQFRTLISAPTNAAVIEVSKRMMRFFDVPRNEELFSGFCSRTQAGLKRCLPISLSNIVLLGSKGRLQGAVDGTMLENIFLCYRVDRLVKALSSGTGWKASVQSAVTFLTKAPALYEAQNAEAPKSDEDHSNSKASKGKNSRTAKKEKKRLARAATFWSFARESTVKLRDQMQKASFVLTSELPQCYMDMTTSNAMIRASDLMAALVDLMPSEAPSEAETWFSNLTTTDTLHERFTNLNLFSSSSTTGKMRFLQAREAVLEALKWSPGCSLFATEKQPKGFVPSSRWLESECLRNATLVFSTVSAAGLPKMVRLEFECGIIDEASQLVEAETTIITRKKGLKQLILVADHKQLPATVISKVISHTPALHELAP